MSNSAKKTPYQGSKRCTGYFHCDFGHRWMSHWSWANCGQRCRVCTEGLANQKKKDFNDVVLEIRYTYPHSQEPLHEIVLFCENEKCENEEESLYSRPRKCRKCGGRMYPLMYLECPYCGYEHEWLDNPKKARAFIFICMEYAENGKGCENVLCIKDGQKEGETTGQLGHRDVLCEKCDQLRCRCTGRRYTSAKSRRDEGISKTEAAEKDSIPGDSASRKKNKKRSRRRKKKTPKSTEDELCDGIRKL